MRLVIPSVDYADMLAAILPAWARLVGAEAITVVTAPRDVPSQEVAAEAKVGLVVTDAWTRQVPTLNGAAGPVIFNKARALDEAFGFRADIRPAPAAGELCLALDADVYPGGQLPAEGELEADLLYGCPRYRCETPAELEAFRRGALTREAFPLIPPRIRGEAAPAPGRTVSPAEAAERCLGYFQLFRYRPGLRFGDYRTAGRYDLDFRRQFRQRRGLTAIYVLHLGALDRQNWRGRVLPRWEATREARAV